MEYRDYKNYRIYADSRVLNIKRNKWLTHSPHSNGYLRIKLGDEGFLSHRLLALMFLPNPNNLPQINHKNGNKHDNRIENLEWSTGSNNIKHAYATGLLQCAKGNQVYGAKLTPEQVKEIRASKGIPQKILAQKYNISVPTISRVIRGIDWKHI